MTLFCGFVGGLGVNVYRLYSASNSPQTKPSFDGIYWAQFFGLALMGAVVAWINDATKEISPLTAFNVGLSIPALIKVGAEQKARKPKSRKIG